MRHNGQRQVTASLGGALVTSPTIHTAVPLVSETTNVSTGRGVKSGWGRGKSGPVWKREIKLGDVESGIICDIILNIPRNLTILKLARDLQHVLSSQDPLTPWHLHSTFMFRSSSWKKIGLVLLHSFKFVFISLVLSIWCRFSWPAHNGSSRVMLVWVWKKSFCPDPLPSLLLWMPTDNGVNFSYLLSLTSALWCSNVPEPSKERISRNDGVGQNYCFDIALFGCFLDGMLLQFFVNWIGCILISKKVLKKNIYFISYMILKRGFIVGIVIWF